MAKSKFSVAWEDYRKNICNGLCGLQQRGDFVDMTLAAEGHLVMAHKMVLSLVSPYIRDLVGSTACHHPVIFLSNVSHETLQSILEYAYSGEVVVANERIQEFLLACKELRIRGLDGRTNIESTQRATCTDMDMDIQQANTNKDIQQANTNKDIQQANTNKDIQQANTNKDIQQAKNNTDIQQAKSNTDIQQAKSNTNIQQAKSNTNIQQAKSNTDIQQANSNTNIQQANSNTHIQKANSNTHIQQANSNTHFDQANSNTNIQQANSNTHNTDTDILEISDCSMDMEPPAPSTVSATESPSYFECYENASDSTGSSDEDDEPLTSLKKPVQNPIVNRNAPDPGLKYTISNQGSAQIVLNRFLYNHRFTRKNGETLWRCFNYTKPTKVTERCRAFVVIKDTHVIQRACSHNHPFHDDIIIRRVQLRNMFGTMSETLKVIEKKAQENIEKKAQKNIEKNEAVNQKRTGLRRSVRKPQNETQNESDRPIEYIEII